MTTFGRLLQWDEQVLVGLSRRRRRALTKFFSVITHLGSGKSWTLVGVVLYLIPTPRTEWLGLMVLYAGASGALVGQVLKRVLKRSRPNARIHGFEAVVHNPDAFSFPSGHTAAAVAMAVAWWGVSTGLGVFMSIMAGLIAFSRVYLGAHYPLDVAAGAFIGLLVGSLARLIV